VTQRPDLASLGASWRLLVDGASDGAWNMAVDEAILEAYASADPKPAPTLRLYGWEPATLSLGRSQRADGSHDAGVMAQEGIGLVRRPTGGGAVLHEFERTYAVIGALGLAPFPGGVIATYRTIAEALTRSMMRLGVAAIPVEPARGSPRDAAAACFERLGAWELAVNGRKLVGSAQARRRGALLQHGSIPMRLDPSRLAKVLGSPVAASRFTDLRSARGEACDPDEVDAACVHGFEETFHVPLVRGSLTEREALRAAELRCWKYDSMAWTRDGAIGPREAHWGPAVSR
jgi:lipoyl(octanoyl) transferase